MRKLEIISTKKEYRDSIEDLNNILNWLRGDLHFKDKKEITLKDHKIITSLREELDLVTPGIETLKRFGSNALGILGLGAIFSLPLYLNEQIDKASIAFMTVAVISSTMTALDEDRKIDTFQLELANRLKN